VKFGRTVIGFHGCDRELARALVLGEKTLRPSRNSHDWLGSGVYFWESDAGRAQDWAVFMANHERFKDRVNQPFRLGAVIDLGNCLDLTESLSLRLVKEAFEQFSMAMREAEIPMPVNEKGHSADEDLIKRNLDCAVINYLHALREKEGQPPFDTVRAAFTEGEPLYVGARIQAKTHIQISVVNPSCIKGVFYPQNLET
jgi:hypothetical protein